MKRIIALPGIIVLCSLLCTISLAQTASTSIEEKSGILPQNVKTFKGRVMGAYDNEMIVLKHEEGYLLVYIKEEHWKLGIARGDEIVVKGTIRTENPLKTHFDAIEIRKTDSPKIQAPPVAIRSIKEINYWGKDNELVAVRGMIEGYKFTKMTLKDDHLLITVELGSTAVRDHVQQIVNRGDEGIILGILKVKPTGVKVIEPITAFPTSFFLREGEPETAEDISVLLKRHPIGELVKAKGRIGMFGSKGTDLMLLYQEENVVIVYRSEKYLSLDAPSGEIVEVVGIFDVETHRGRERGVIKEARIDSVSIIKKIEKLTPPEK